MSSRFLSLPVVFVGAALCLTASAQPSSDEPFGIGGAAGGEGVGGSLAVGGAGGRGTGGTAGTSGTGAIGDGGQTSGDGGAGGGSTNAAAVAAGAGGFGNDSTREIDSCNCRNVKRAPTEPAILWLVALGGALIRCRRRSR